MSETAARRTTRKSSVEKRKALRAELYERAERGDLELREAVRMMRKITGRTQADYAKMVGVSARVLIEFERGIGNPTLKTLEKMLSPFSLELTLRRRPPASPE